ncbi:MAG: hypothetical protein Q7S81_03560 [bacterium]|nr:hypothetical protein [bacterium]
MNNKINPAPFINNKFLNSTPTPKKGCGIKLILLLTFGFFALSVSSSLAAYNYDLGRNCFTVQSNGDLTPNNLPANEICSIQESAKLRLDGGGAIRSIAGVNLNLIKVPYGQGGENAQYIKTVIQSTNSVDWSKFGNLTQDYGCARRGGGIQTIPSIPECDGHAGANPCVTPYLLGAQIYINTKTAMIRSCLPGSLAATRRGNIACALTFGTYGNIKTKNTFLTVGNFPDGSISGCGLKDPGAMSISSNIVPTSGETGDQAYRNGRREVADQGSFTINWTLSNPGANCTLSGKDATTLEDFSQSIKADAVAVDGSTGAITPAKGEYTFSVANEGIYRYTLSCYGVLDGKVSPERGTVPTDPITIYVGNIPADPEINFNAIESENLTKYTGVGANYQVPINMPVKLSWEVENAKSVKLWKQKTILDKKIILSTATVNNTAKPQTLNFEGTDTGGFYTFWLEAEGKFPEQKKASQKIIIYAKEAGKVAVPEGQFTADRTEIQKGEPVVLSWNISGASEININQGVGKVKNDGSATVNPDVTTTYTLTAKNIIANGPDTKKTVTIAVKAGEITSGLEITPFVPPADQEIIGVATSTKQTIDLKVNETDGPVTLSAPATFTLSWNLDTYCLATGSWLSVKTKAGNESVSLNKNGRYTYSLYCPGYGSDSVEINIVNSSNSGLLGGNGLLGGLGLGGSGTVSMPFAEASVSTDQINYSQNIRVIRGEPTDIYIKVDQDINSDGKTTRDSSGLWSELLSFGGYCLYNNNLIIDPPKFDGMVRDPETSGACNTKLGTFTFSDEPGTYKYGVFKLLQNDDKFSNISYINIIVENVPSPETAPVIDLKINGNDASEQVLGTPASFNVFWDVINATTCEASGSWSGSKNLSGIQSFVSSSKKDFIYTLTCAGQLGTTSKSITLRVAEAPVCSFTALPPSLNKTSAFVTESELSWKCDYADECSLSPNTTNATIKTYGSLRVSPAQTTNYILTCNNSDVFKSFEAKVEVISE